MDSIKNSANFELSFIYFCEQYAWFTRVHLIVLCWSKARERAPIFGPMHWLPRQRQYYWEIVFLASQSYTQIIKILNDLCAHI